MNGQLLRRLVNIFQLRDALLFVWEGSNNM